MPIISPAHPGLKLGILLTAAMALNFGAPADSSAQLKPKRSQAVCACQCDAGTGGIKDATYPGMAACSGYEGKTCNYEDSNGVIKTGTVRACSADNVWVNPAAAAASPHSAGVLVQPRPVPQSPRAPAATTADPR